VAAIGQTPQIKGAYTAASYRIWLSPQCIGSAFGTGFTDKAYTPTIGASQRSLGNVEVLICDPLAITCNQADLLYASPTQINFVMPQNVPGQNSAYNGSASIIVANTSNLPFVLSTPLPIRVLPWYPDIFLLGSDCSFDPAFPSGAGCSLGGKNSGGYSFLRGAITDTAGQIVFSGHPATAGSYYTIWLTGLGQFLSDNPPSLVTLNLYESGKGSKHQVNASFVGLAPGFVGLDQINFQIPANIFQPTCSDQELEFFTYVVEGGMEYSSGTSIPVLIPANCPAGTINMAGSWQLTANSSTFGLRFEADGQIIQMGNSLSGQFTTLTSPCVSHPPATFTGTLSGDAVILNVTEGEQVVFFSGTVSPDGNSATGTYSAPSGGCTNADKGTWSGIRVSIP
jgi:uncharacterized protein (TIGR03437 family)